MNLCTLLFYLLFINLLFMLFLNFCTLFKPQYGVWTVTRLATEWTVAGATSQQTNREAVM